MKKLSQTEPIQVFKYFEEICAIPHGSCNMNAISKYCVEFAKKNGLKVIHDDTNNVIIYKPGTKGYENSEPIILQGHLDMVCQKTEDTVIDFEKDGLDVYIDGDFVKARGTTLGADNGIAVSMVMAILASKDLAHPPIEAVFTTDEEIGMIGAENLDTSLLKGRKMINLDAEEADFLTVSCAGGSDFKLFVPADKKTAHGTKISFAIRNLKGGHSGVEIDKGRVNANILAGRILNYAKQKSDFDIIKVNGGDKGNAIPFSFNAELVTDDSEALINLINDYFAVIKKEICAREKDCCVILKAEGKSDFEVLSSSVRDKLIYMLLTTPNGITDMSAEIEGLVETSLNLGVLATENDKIVMQYALRSNKKSALDFLEEKLTAFADYHGCKSEISGRYQPWEFKDNSPLQKLYIDAFCEKFGHKPQVAAIHAGLESAVFSAKMDDLDCIAVGPDMFGVHTVNEKLSITSAKAIFELLCKILEKCK